MDYKKVLDCHLRPGGLLALLFRSINGVMFLIERKSNFDKMVGEFWQSRKNQQLYATIQSFQKKVQVSWIIGEKYDKKNKRVLFDIMYMFDLDRM